MAIAPSQSSGLEYPGALQFGDTAPDDLADLAAHELAHQWFYALVGNDQARDPWLDEAFATYSQAVVTGSRDDFPLDDVPDRVRGDLGDPMSVWADRGFGPYNTGVYTQGAAVLLAAREAPAPSGSTRRCGPTSARTRTASPPPPTSRAPSPTCPP